MFHSHTLQAPPGCPIETYRSLLALRAQVDSALRSSASGLETQLRRRPRWGTSCVVDVRVTRGVGEGSEGLGGFSPHKAQHGREQPPGKHLFHCFATQIGWERGLRDAESRVWYF